MNATKPAATVRRPSEARRRVPVVLGLAALALVSAPGARAAAPVPPDVPGARAGAPTTTAAAVGTSRAKAHLRRDLDGLVRDDGLPGATAVVVDRHGRSRAYRSGTGDLAKRTPMPSDGRVRIASNTKSFTAVVVLQLVGEGKVDLDGPIETYLPGLVRGVGIEGRTITVRQLLQQTSGLPDYDQAVITGGDLLAVLHTYYEPRQLLDAALTGPAHFPPGTRWEYSNTNYLLLGLLVQRVTGRPIGEEITGRVINRLKLADTYWPATGEQIIRGRHPRGYYAPAPGARWTDVTRLDPSIGWAAGQLVSTPGDLATFTRDLLAGRLLAARELKQMLTTVGAPGFEPGTTWRYGLGLAGRTLRCGVVAWGHGGDITGFETRNLATADGRAAVVATNALPTSLKTLEHVNAAVEDGICG